MNSTEPGNKSRHTFEQEELPRPTYAPVALAMGIAMTFWGFIALSLNINAVWFMSLVGAGLMSWSLRSWIREIVIEWESSR